MAKKLNPNSARLVELHLCDRKTGAVDRVENFLDCRPAEKVASDLNQLLVVIDSKYEYRVPGAK